LFPRDNEATLTNACRETETIEGQESMKTPIKMTPVSVLLFVTLVFGADISAQAPGQSLPPVAGTVPDIQRPNPTGSNPKPEDATAAILAAFEKYEVVGMSAAHGDKDLDDFILGLIRNPAFPSKVSDVAVECGNSLYQPILDRYIAGDAVSLSEVGLVWRNTTQTMCGMSGFYEELFPLVRKINKKLAPERRLRVLAGDPAFDWSKVRGRGDIPGVRDESIAAVMEKEVLSKHRKALMLFGTFHLLHRGNTPSTFPSAVELYEKDYPGVTLVIADHEGFGNWTALAKYNDEFEARMASWPVPTLIKNIQGTWLADLLDVTYSPGAIRIRFIQGPSGMEQRIVPIVLSGFSKMVDSYLYLGPRDLQLREPRPAEISLDRDYMAELQRRATLLGEEPIDPGKPLSGESNLFLYDPDFLQKGIQEHCQRYPELPCVTPPEVHPSDRP
jgi:hypothetical protein